MSPKRAGRADGHPVARRIGLCLAIALGLGLIALATLPWWLGFAARHAGARHGLTLGAYDQIGYSRWAAHDVVWRSDGVTVKIARIEGDHPLLWWWNPRGQTGAKAGEWSVVIAEPAQAPQENDTSGWRETWETILEVRQGLNRWLPRADVGPGEVRWPGDGLRLAGARWADDQLRVEKLSLRGYTGDVRLAWQGDAAHLAATGNEQPWEVEARASATMVNGRLVWQEQPAEFAAEWESVGWIPREAAITGSAWRLPGATLKMERYYAEVSGNFAAHWRNGAVAVKVQADGVPPGESDLPRLRARIDGEANKERVTVRSLELRAPGVEAALEQPVTFDPRSEWAATEALFQIEADLAQLPLIEGAQGRVEGQVRVQPREGQWPRAYARLQLSNVAWAEWRDVQASTELVFEHPSLTVNSAKWRDAMGSDVDARARVDLSTRRVDDGELVAQISLASVARWLPEAVHFERAAVEGKFSGPWSTLAHRGEFAATNVTWARTHPIALKLGWSGEGTTADIHGAASTSAGAMRAVAQATPEHVRVAELIVAHADDELWRIQEPVTVRWNPAWQIENVRIIGRSVELAAEVDDVAAGRVAVQAPRVSLEWISDWWAEPLPAQQIRNLSARGDLMDQVLVFSAGAEIGATLAGGQQVWLATQLKGDERGVVVERFSATVAGQSVIEMAGRLPATLRPGASPVLHVEPQGELSLHGQIAPSVEFWTMVAERTGVQVDDPRVAVDLAGRWDQPRGSAHIAAARIAWTGERSAGRWPVLTGFDARLRGDGTGLALEQLKVEVEGQPLTASARLPLTPAEWSRARQAPIDYLRERGEAHLELADAELAAFARLVPDYLAPAGKIDARLEFAPGGRIDGVLKLAGAVTRPLGPLGVLQDVQADLAFSGRELTVRRVEARMGGQPVRLSGRAALLEGGAPRLDLRLEGQNLPLVRDVGLLLRADLNLSLVSNERGDGRVTGQVRLRDSLFLAELQDVLPRGGGGGGGRPNTRPPYFSVSTDPLQRWQLDVMVEGKEFLRLRTPVVEGTASARFQLSGTLGEPRAVGEARVDQGRVRLPFATFQIQEGELRLTQADPYQPQVSLTGTSRRMGYDLRMELTGTAAEPRLQFYSSPSLPSEDILLLVMAGQAPQEEVSYTGSQRAVQIGTFIGRGVISDLFGGSGGDRLSITTGERVSRQGRETYRFNYELTPRLALVGEYDEFDSYNAGVRWRLLPRRGDHPDDEQEETDATAE
jgi:translocation and assembly module TamB